jgi:1,4-dihydroxy-2-naphthoyl-CoA hydrolase
MVALYYRPYGGTTWQDVSEYIGNKSQITWNQELGLNLLEFKFTLENPLDESSDPLVIEVGDDFVKASMPVNERTKQPMGLLHGGASAALIESVASLGSTLLLDLTKEYAVGLEVNANHLAGVHSGYVKAIGKIVHAGKRTHVWQVDIFDSESNRMVCTGRLTCLVVQREY